MNNLFKTRLKELRQNKNLKQSDVADALGITVIQYQRYEYGKSFPRYMELLQLADFFECSLDFLCGRDI
jgi:transcriptional regulator with XRE-family HTH domain